MGGQAGHVRIPAGIVRRNDRDLGIAFMNPDQPEEGCPQGLLLLTEKPAHQPRLLLAPGHSFEPPDDVADEGVPLSGGEGEEDDDRARRVAGAWTRTTEPSPYTSRLLGNPR